MLSGTSVSLEEVAVKDESAFWNTFGNALRRNCSAVKTITTFGDFLNAFDHHAWTGEKIVIMIDEFDQIFNASDEIRDNCLSAFRAIRQNNNQYAIDSIIACGTFSLLPLTTSNPRVSPFNVNSSIRNPYFSFDDTQTLFKEYAQDEDIEIDELIVEEIFHNTNGYVQPWSSVLYCYGLSTLIVSIMAPPVQLQ